jgi:hypothetical protein
MSANKIQSEFFSIFFYKRYISVIKYKVYIPHKIIKKHFHYVLQG